MLTSFNPDTSLQPASYLVNDPLPQDKPNALEKPKNLQKQRHIILTGIENQLLDFNNLITPLQDKPKNLSLCLGEAKFSLEKVKKANGYEEKDKINHAARLNTFYNTLPGYLEQFNNLKQDLEKASTSKQQANLQDQFNRISNMLKKNKADILSLFEISKIKLKKLKLRIEKDNFHPAPTQTELNNAIYWLQKDVPDYIIKHATDAALEKAKSRVKIYKELEATLQKTMLQFNDVLNQEENLKLALEAIPAILKEKQQTLSNLSASLNTSRRILDRLDMAAFSKDFKELAEKRDLTSFYKILENCQTEVIKMAPFKEPLDQINNEFLVHDPSDESKSKDNFSAKIKGAVANISLKIIELNNSMIENLGDREFGKRLEEQKQAAIANLQVLQNGIITNYNSYRLELNNANYHFLVFNRLVNIKAKLVRLYLDTETVRSTMREMRKLANSTRQEHQNTYNICKSRFEEIKNRILLVNTEPLFYYSFSDKTITSVDNSSRMFVIEAPLAQTLSKQIAQLSEDDSVYFNSQAKINSLIADNKKNDALAEQIQQLQTHLKTEKDKIITAYTVTLKDMCEKAKEEINLMGKALTYIHDTHDNDFGRAYTNKNYLTKKLQENLCAYGEYQEYSFPSDSDFSAQTEPK